MAERGQFDFDAGSLADDSPPFSVRVARMYTHMGSKVTVDSQPIEEIKRRSGMMYTSMRSIRRRVLQNPRLQLSLKVQLSTTLLHTRLQFNAGAWPRLGTQAFAIYAHAFVAPLRLASGMTTGPADDKFTDEAVLLHCGTSSAAISLRRLRLKLFVRLCWRAPVPLLRLIFASTKERASWANAVVHDLAFAQSGNPDLQCIPAPAERLAEWISLARTYPQKFKSRLLKGASLSHRTTPHAAVDLQPDFQCPDCPRSFIRFDNLQAHRNRIHGYRNPLALKVIGADCMSCARCFHSTPKLFRHVAYASAKCKDKYLKFVPDATDHARQESYVAPAPKKYLQPPPLKFA